MNQLENEWFYLDGNTRQGPLTADKMRSMLAEGRSRAPALISDSSPASGSTMNVASPVNGETLSTGKFPTVASRLVTACSASDTGRCAVATADSISAAGIENVTTDRRPLISPPVVFCHQTGIFEPGRTVERHLCGRPTRREVAEPGTSGW